MHKILLPVELNSEKLEKYGRSGISDNLCGLAVGFAEICCDFVIVGGSIVPTRSMSYLDIFGRRLGEQRRIFWSCEPIFCVDTIHLESSDITVTVFRNNILQFPEEYSDITKYAVESLNKIAGTEIQHNTYCVQCIARSSDGRIWIIFNFTHQLVYYARNREEISLPYIININDSGNILNYSVFPGKDWPESLPSTHLYGFRLYNSYIKFIPESYQRMLAAGITSIGHVASKTFVPRDLDGWQLVMEYVSDSAELKGFAGWKRKKKVTVKSSDVSLTTYVSFENREERILNLFKNKNKTKVLFSHSDIFKRRLQKTDKTVLYKPRRCPKNSEEIDKFSGKIGCVISDSRYGRLEIVENHAVNAERSKGSVNFTLAKPIKLKNASECMRLLEEFANNVSSDFKYIFDQILSKFRRNAPFRISNTGDSKVGVVIWLAKEFCDQKWIVQKKQKTITREEFAELLQNIKLVHRLQGQS